MAYLDRADRKGNLDRAIESFERVLAADVRKDPELLDLRSDPRYHRLVAGLAGKS